MSKELEALEKLGEIEICYDIDDLTKTKYVKHSREYGKSYRCVENALQAYEKEHQALEIIKKKNIRTDEIKRCSNAEDYNDLVCELNIENNDCFDDDLTEQEFNLLKETLE